MNPKMHIIKEVLKERNFEEALKDLNQKIIMKENMLQKRISDNHKEIITNCASISDIKFGNTNIAQTTQKLTEFVLNSAVKINEMKTNDEILSKVNEINAFIVDLLLIIKTSEQEPVKLHDYFHAVKKLKENFNLVKNFKNFIFYDVLKKLVKNKKQEIILGLKKESDGWIGTMLTKYKNIGERIMNNEIVLRKELDLPTIFVSYYINNQLDHSEEYLNYFNSKRENISQNLRIFEVIGFLYVEKILTDKNHKFSIEIKRNDFEKEELTLFIKFLRKYNFDSSKQEEKLEKICCDYIFQQREIVEKKDDIDIFKKTCLDFLKDVDQPCVYEIFYKTLDNFYVEYFEEFDYLELNKKLKDLEKSRSDMSFDFQTNSRLKKVEENLLKRIDKIFNDEKYNELYAPDIFLEDKIIIYIRDKFIDKIKNKHGLKERRLEGEIVKFYSHLKGIKQSMGDLFFKAVEATRNLD